MPAALLALPVLALATACGGGTTGPTPQQSAASAAAVTSAQMAALRTAQTQRVAAAAQVQKQMSKAMLAAGLAVPAQNQAVAATDPTGCQVEYRYAFSGDDGNSFTGLVRGVLTADGWTVGTANSLQTLLTRNGWQISIGLTKLPNPNWKDTGVTGTGLMVDFRAQNQDPACGY